jgi:hypothetical protein
MDDRVQRLRFCRMRLTADIASVAAVVILAAAWPCFGEGANPVLCAGTSIRVGTFRLMLASARGGSPLPVNSVSMIEPGDLLKYEPVQLPRSIQKRARIALVIAPSADAGHKQVEVLAAQPANSAAKWIIPMRASVLGLVFGPQGLDVKRVSALVRRNPDLIPELAKYAQQSATVNALVETLAQYDSSRPGSEDLNAVLAGFSAQYNVALPTLDTRAPTDQQAQILLQGIMPSMSNYSPFASEQSLVVQQSAGLAGAVATLFYGTPVGLAAGGAELFENMRLMMFPGTDFRAAFVQPAGSSGLELCSNNKPPAPRTRIAYLWMLRVPDAGPPVVSLTKLVNVPAGSKVKIPLRCATRGQLALVPHARDWRLTSGTENIAIPVSVTVGPSEDSLSLDLTHAKVAPGTYQLAALWDWTPLNVLGSLHVRLPSDFAQVRLTPDSQDCLVQDTGPVRIVLTGADFEFVNRVAIVKGGDPDADAWPLSFSLPKGRDGGEQLSLSAEVETSVLTPGAYKLLLTQSDDNTQSVPVTVHPPDPKLANVPLRANLGLKRQTLLLRGTGLERVQQITSRGATWQLAPLAPGSINVTQRQATIILQPDAHVGDLLSARLHIEGLQKPIEVPGVLEVAGPLPAIVSVKESFPREGNVELRPGEIPAGATVSFAIHAAHLDSLPDIHLACASTGDTREALDLHPGDRIEAAQLDIAGEGLFFLSLQPGAVGRSGCVLTTSATDPDTGTSAPYNLGTIIRLPRIDRFTLTNEKAGNAMYIGSLTGLNLQTVVETGWNDHSGYAVLGIPTPVPGNPQEQTLEIELPWPPPSPRAPLYIWLLGDSTGRRTSASY